MQQAHHALGDVKTIKSKVYHYLMLRNRLASVVNLFESLCRDRIALPSEIRFTVSSDCANGKLATHQPLAGSVLLQQIVKLRLLVLSRRQIYMNWWSPVTQLLMGC